MAKRSLRASVDGISQIKAIIKRRKLNQTYLAGQIGCSRQTIWGFLNGNPIEADFFMAVCQHLGLDHRDVAEPNEQERLAEPMEIDRVVNRMRLRLEPVVTERCGTMRVFDMEKPIGLDDIYTDVNIFERLSHRQRQRLSDLQQQIIDNYKDFETFGYSHHRVKERVPGLTAIEQYSKLMILGKPGAGKTTFLKRVAMECNTGKMFADRVVLFVTLKDFAEAKGKPELLEYITNQLAQISPPSPTEPVRETAVSILQAGRMLLLLDGLDEVLKQDETRVTQDIKELGTVYPKNRLVLTCRIASQEYTFENFVEIEVADFDDLQMGVFVTKWFAQRDPVKAEPFLRRLREKDRVRALASTPLLLTLLCLGFEETNHLDISRSGLYKEGLEVLLKKWDAKRNIQRGEIYKNLSAERKQALLSQLAYNTFLGGDYFFAQATAESEIGYYIANLPDSPVDPKELALDSEAVLKAITAQHGLLIERANEIYSFSHLTFHEYFTAQSIVSMNSEVVFDQLVEYLFDNRWREIFLLTVEMLPRADLLLQKMQGAIDGLVANNGRLQKLLGWAQEKALSVTTEYKPQEIRSFYLSFTHAFDLYNARTKAQKRTRTMPIIHPQNQELDLDHTLNIAYTLDLGHDLDDTLNLDEDDLGLDLNDVLDYAHALARELHQDELAITLRSLQAELSKANTSNTLQWWEKNAQDWLERLRQAMIQHRNIGHDWTLGEKDRGLLEQYWAANQLLVECLQSECYVTRTVREEIECNLLLPGDRSKARSSAKG
jgi:predicted NACHT family NTPase